jgi:preprotein translocase subunit SecD
MNRLSVIILFSLLLSSPSFAQDAANPAQKMFQDRVEKVKWKNVSVEFRPVSDKSSKGAQPMVVESVDQENGKTYHVDKKVILGLKDIANVDVTYNPNDISLVRIIMFFDQEGQKTLADYTTKHLGEQMGVIIDGKLRLVANIRQPLVNGKVQVYGLAPNEAVDIARRYYEPKLELARQINEELQNKQ